MTTFIDDYIAKLTEDSLKADSVQEIDRIGNIIRVLLKYKNSI
jgi:hypothetical protein